MDTESTITKNVRKILTLLAHAGPLSKMELVERAQISWATVSKLVNRLLAQQIIKCEGTSPRQLQKGKNAYIYSLTGSKPLAVGVDMEYKTTTMLLTNLRGDEIYQRVYKTPANPTSGQLRNFFRLRLESFISNSSVNEKDLSGIGIGIPGIGIPSWLKPRREDENLAESLEQDLGYPVSIENNIRAYTMFEKWGKQLISLEELILVSIRSGVGSGIIIGGELYSGQQGLAGELGHFEIVPKGLPCRCGKRGCLETVVNQNAIYREYAKTVLHKERLPQSPPKEKIVSGLSDLFHRAALGEVAARRLVEKIAGFLGPPMAQMIMLFNIPQVILSAYFGPHGGVLVDVLRREIDRTILSKMQYSLRYIPFDEKGFTRGAALLILRRFFSDVPLLLL